MSETIVQRALSSGVLSAEDFLSLRRSFGADFDISVEEADTLFRLNDQVETPDGWAEYFINVIKTFLIFQTPPTGYISAAKAAWLMMRIEQDGMVETETELQLLLQILKHGDNVTDRLEKFALDQVRHAVLNGDGYLGRGRTLTPGTIGQAEVEIMRQVLYAVSSENGIGISRMEAEFLVDMNEQTLGANNHESWQHLFVCGLANHLMMLAPWEEPSLEEALRREQWLEDTSPQGFLSIKNILRSAKVQPADAPSGFAHMDGPNLSHAETVTSDEASWLIARLNRDGGIDENEKALLLFLAEECPRIHDSLKPLIRAA